MNTTVNLAKTLIPLSKDPKDNWTIEDSFKGCGIMGSTGSGKTTASGKRIALTFLKEGWGGLVLCAKNDEAQLWQEYCNRPDVNRGDDLIIFGKGSIHESGKLKGEKMVFNPIDYEMQRVGAGARETQNITNIFMNVYRMGNRIASEGDTKEERYWDTALKRCLNRVIELIKLAEIDLTYKNMVKILSTSNSVTDITFTDMINCLDPTEPDDPRDKITKEEQTALSQKAEKTLNLPSNFCLKCLVNAYFLTSVKKGDSNVMDKDEEDNERTESYYLVRDYFVHDMPAMGSKTKSVVTESFMGLAEPFLSGLLSKHFAGKTNLFPEETYLNKKIIVLNFPIKEFLDAGIIAQSIFKLLFQQAIERRNSKIDPNPVFLWCDEAQYFVNSYDQIFLTTARSSRTATVFLSQNISNYYAVMGSGSDAKARVDSLMGNLCTKIFHANSDAETNEYASRLIGSAPTPLTNVGTSHSTFGLQDTDSQGLSMQYLPQIQPREFTTLKTGGEFNDYQVEAILTVNGRKWADKNNYIPFSIEQDFPDKKPYNG
ncbi:MAG: TraM recognition site of TraD and TraG [Bacteroidota bacterium]|nr:TraM recognition site of TraD and TraG [Bacteroidota bacterium]